MSKDCSMSEETTAGKNAEPCPYEANAREARRIHAQEAGLPFDEEDERDPVETELREKKKDLVIIALTDYTAYGDAAVSHAVALCLIFRAELCILPLHPGPHSFSEVQLHSLEVAEEHHIPITQHPYENRLLKNIHSFAEEINAMMMVIGISQKRKDSYFNRKKALRWILPSRIPVMAVGNRLPEADAYQRVLLPIDSSVYCKEKALWAGYFNRFYKADIHLLYKEYKDPYLFQKVEANLFFTKKIYGNLDIPFQKHSIEDNWKEVDLCAQELASEIRAGLIVSMTTRYPTAGDVLFGRKEKKMLRRVSEIPLLLINQREDLYVLCT